MLDGRRTHALFLFEDLAAEASHLAQLYGLPFCKALRIALTAFQIDFVQSRNAAIAHAAASARLEVIGMLSSACGSSPRAPRR